MKVSNHQEITLVEGRIEYLTHLVELLLRPLMFQLVVLEVVWRLSLLFHRFDSPIIFLFSLLPQV